MKLVYLIIVYVIWEILDNNVNTILKISHNKDIYNKISFII